MLAEILPSVDAVKDNILEGLTYETVMEYEYLMHCFHESLRIEPPTGSSAFLTMDTDSLINVGGNKSVLIKKDSTYVINMLGIHHDPKQWIEPDVFCPDRFDTTLPDNKWAQAADGKPRAPMAFNPFLGGKRVCLGKTFAEVTVRFTLPLLFHHLDFNFVSADQGKAPKPFYTIGSVEQLKVPVKVTIKNRL